MRSRRRPRAPGRVRPPVMAYGRTRGPASASYQRRARPGGRRVPSCGGVMSRRRPGPRCAGWRREGPRGRGRGPQVLADAPDEARHLVGDQPEVSGRGAEHGQAGALPCGGDEQERGVHLHHRLADPAGAEVPAGALGEAVEAGGDGREVLGVGAAQGVGGAHGEAVVGQHDGVVHVVHPRDEVVQEPVEPAAGSERRGGGVFVPGHRGSPSRPWALRVRGWGEDGAVPPGRRARVPGAALPPRVQPSR